MEDNDGVVCDDAFEEIDESSTKINVQHIDENEEDTTTEYLDLDLETDILPETEEYYPALPKHRRGRRSKKLLDVKSQCQTTTSKPNYSSTAELKLGPKYRPIRPKPYQPNITTRNKLFGIQPTVNVSTLSSPNRFIVTTSLPAKEKFRDVTVLDTSSNKTNNYIKPVNGNIGNIMSVTKENNSDKNVIGNSSLVIKKDLRNIKVANKSPKSSIELFFESMAQTVLNLPLHAQAEIKMEICKLVTMAEINYCGSQSKHSHKNG